MGPQLVAKSVFLIWRNLGAAMRATLIPLGVVLGLSAVLLWPVLSEFGANVSFTTEDPVGIPPGVVAPILLSAALFAFGFVWAAVVWHRFVLLEEAPGWLPRPPVGRIGAYVWAFVRLLGPFLLALVAALLLLQVVFLAAGAISSPAVLIVLTSGVSVVFSYILLRFSLVLPAAAIGAPMSLGDSWTETGDPKVSILAVALLLGLLQVVLQTVGGALPLLGWPGVALSLLVSWFSALLSLSILTTLYGVLVEGRPVD